MSIKVYLHIEEQDLPKKTSKLTIPKKWVQEKTLLDVIEVINFWIIIYILNNYFIPAIS